MVRRIFGWLVGWLVGGKTVKKERWQGHSRWRKKEFKYNFFLSFFFLSFLFLTMLCGIQNLCCLTRDQTLDSSQHHSSESEYNCIINAMS